MLAICPWLGQNPVPIPPCHPRPFPAATTVPDIIRDIVSDFIRPHPHTKKPPYIGRLWNSVLELFHLAGSQLKYTLTIARNRNYCWSLAAVLFLKLEACPADIVNLRALLKLHFEENLRLACTNKLLLTLKRIY